MFSSPFVRRLLMISLAFCLLCFVVLGLVGLSVSVSEQATSTLYWRLMVAWCGLMVVGLLLATRLTQRWMALVTELTIATRLMSHGQKPDRIPVDSDDELGQLSQAFNEMAQSVESRRTASQRVQQTVARDNEQLATVLEAMVEGVIAVDHEERILLANMAAIRLLDLKSFQVVNRRIWEVIRSPQLNDLIRRTVAGAVQQRMEFEVPWTQSTVAVVASRLPGDPCPGAVLVLHDITDLRRLERLRREFVSNVSHELKTPLAAITAYAETLLDGALEDPKVSQTFVGRIAEQSERLNSLILDLLELARLESGEHMFVVDAVEVEEVVRQSIEAHQAIAQAKQVTLKSTTTEFNLWAEADAEGLRTILDNLIGNAINYTRAEGEIAIRSRRHDEWISIEVKDNGVGIAKEFQSRIFERFFRVDRARSREVGGTGLGLSIVKHLCQLFGGSIKVSSQVGQGSTFIVQLKASGNSSAIPDPPTPQAF